LEIVCAVFILKEDGSALLQHRDNKPGLRHPDFWTIPGGHADPGETLEQCARREVLEETNYKCHDLHLIETFIHNDDVGVDYELSLYWTLYDPSQKYVCLEGQELRFVSRQDADKLKLLKFLLSYWDHAIAVMPK
jgi:8-oxo-dGTP pyrophosphatase MutT (NUDIX family)